MGGGDQHQTSPCGERSGTILSAPLSSSAPFSSSQVERLMLEPSQALLLRLTEALERLAPPAPPPVDLYAADAFVWHPASSRLAPVEHVSRVDIELLKGIEQQKAILL